jgi:hypothetical protein
MKSAFRPLTRELVFDIDMTDCKQSRQRVIHQQLTFWKQTTRSGLAARTRRCAGGAGNSSPSQSRFSTTSCAVSPAPTACLAAVHRLIPTPSDQHLLIGRRLRLQAHPLGLLRSAWYPRVDLGPRRAANDGRAAFGHRAVHRHRQGLHKHGQAHGAAPALAPDNRVSRIARATLLRRHRASTQQNSDSPRSSAPQTGGFAYGTAAVGVCQGGPRRSGLLEKRSGAVGKGPEPAAGQG